MVDKNARSVIIIAVILVVAVACGYIFINGAFLQDFLKENGLFHQAGSVGERLPVSSGAETVSPDPIAGSGKVSFEKAINELYLFDSEGLINLENTTFHEIRGTGVDRNGSADIWLIGARKNGDKVIFAFDSGGWSEMIWPGSLPEEVIDLENNTSPEALFTKNSDTITGYYQNAKASGSDLIMDSDTCTITIENGDKVEVLKFKTDSGELI